MAGMDDGLEHAFRMPEDRRLGIELSLELGGDAPDLGFSIYAFRSLATVRSYIVSTAAFLRWHEGDGPLGSPRAAAVAQEYLNFLGAFSEDSFLMLSPEFVLESVSRLDLLAAALGNNFLSGRQGELDLRIEFVGAFRQNPTKFRFVAYMPLFVGGIAVAMLGAVQVMKELDAPACRTHYGDILRHQTDVILQQAKLEGRLTAQHRESLETATKAAQAGAAACGSALSHLGMKLTASPTRAFEITMGAAGITPAQAWDRPGN